MKGLLDESVPVQLRQALTDHEVATVAGLGWKGLENGELLLAAERAGFAVLVLADKNLRYQQNLAQRKIAIVEVWTNHRPTLERHFDYIAGSVAGLQSGEYRIVQAP